MKNNKHNINKLIIIFSIYLSFIFLSWAVTSDGIVLSDVLEKFSLAGNREGMTSTMKSIGSVLALLLIFVLTGRIKKPVMIVATGLAAAVSFFMMGSSDITSVFLIWTLLSGFGEAAVDSLMNSYLLDVNGTGNSIFMNMLHGFYGIGGIIGPAIFAGMYLKNGYRYIYHAAGILLFVGMVQFVIVSAVMSGKVKTEETSEEISSISGKDIASYICNKRNIVIMLCMIAAQSAQKCVSVWVTRYCDVVLSNFEIGAICISALWIGVTLSRFLFPLLKIRLEKSIGWCMILSAAAFFIGMLFKSGPVMLAGTALFGLISGSTIPDIITFAARGYEDNTSLSTTMMSLMMFGASLVLSLLMTAIISISNIQTAVGTVMILCASVGVLALITFSDKSSAH